MPVEIDTTEAPALLRFRVIGAVPTPEEQQRLRAELIEQGLLTSGSVSLLDLRDIDTPDALTVAKSFAAAARAGIPGKAHGSTTRPPARTWCRCSRA